MWCASFDVEERPSAIIHAGNKCTTFGVARSKVPTAAVVHINNWITRLYYQDPLSDPQYQTDLCGRIFTTVLCPCERRNGRRRVFGRRGKRKPKPSTDENDLRDRYTAVLQPQHVFHTHIKVYVYRPDNGGSGREP